MQCNLNRAMFCTWKIIIETKCFHVIWVEIGFDGRWTSCSCRFECSEFVKFGNGVKSHASHSKYLHTVFYISSRRIRINSDSCWLWNRWTFFGKLNSSTIAHHRLPFIQIRGSAFQHRYIVEYTWNNINFIVDTICAVANHNSSTLKVNTLTLNIQVLCYSFNTSSWISAANEIYFSLHF